MDYVVRYCGLTPAQAFHAATGANVRVLGIDDVTGAVAPGRQADLVVVAGTIIGRPSVTWFDELDKQLDSF